MIATLDFFFDFDVSNRAQSKFPFSNEALLYHVLNWRFLNQKKEEEKIN